MKTARILVLGSGGQLGQEFQNLRSAYPSYDFKFIDRTKLDLQHLEAISDFLESHRGSYLVNCAAYTAVDKAEAEPGQAFRINAEAVGELAACCDKFGIRFIHYSTDYVFDGESSAPYKEEAQASPVNTYGASKRRGEELCLSHNQESIIIRTSWVYSAFGNNFVKTMMRLLSERDSIKVVQDQVGSPTWAADLAEATMQIISSEKWIPGIYHYANAGIISWYEFALAIKDLIHSPCNVHPIAAIEYPTAARRPAFSLLDTSKISATYSINISDWRTSLIACLKQLQS
ncbi:MAG TPA: dTDP-4-dehydrorhamnose reductase [Flavitalea sp.]|nr:dTDP-4-dehydrorhamnose reductase [Flavitalea sp.]